MKTLTLLRLLCLLGFALLTGVASGFTANPPAASTPPTTPSSYAVLPPLNGTFTVRCGGQLPGH